MEKPIMIDEMIKEVDGVFIIKSYNSVNLLRFSCEQFYDEPFYFKGRAYKADSYDAVGSVYCIRAFEVQLLNRIKSSEHI